MDQYRKTSVQKLQEATEKLCSIDNYGAEFRVHDPISRYGENEDVFTLCDSPQLKVDHDVQMLVRLKPSLKHDKQEEPPMPRFGSGIQPSEGEQAAELERFLQEKEPTQNMETIHVRVLTAGSDRELEPSMIKIELTSDQDIFFHYVCL